MILILKANVSLQGHKPAPKIVTQFRIDTLPACVLIRRYLCSLIGCFELLPWRASDKISLTFFQVETYGGSQYQSTSTSSCFGSASTSKAPTLTTRSKDPMQP